MFLLLNIANFNDSKIMSNLQAAVKVADQIVARIFDQRQFTSGEINYLSREIGERINLEDNFNKILRINQTVCVISDLDNELSKTDVLVAKSIHDEVDELQKRTDRILKIEDEHRRKEDELLAEMRRERDKAKEECATEVATKLKDLKETLASEELELQRKYQRSVISGSFRQQQTAFEENCHFSYRFENEIDDYCYRFRNSLSRYNLISKLVVLSAKTI